MHKIAGLTGAPSSSNPGSRGTLAHLDEGWAAAAADMVNHVADKWEFKRASCTYSDRHIVSTMLDRNQYQVK